MILKYHVVLGKWSHEFFFGKTGWLKAIAGVKETEQPFNWDSWIYSLSGTADDQGRASEPKDGLWHSQASAKDLAPRAQQAGRGMLSPGRHSRPATSSSTSGVTRGQFL